MVVPFQSMPAQKPCSAMAIAEMAFDLAVGSLNQRAVDDLWL